MTGAKRGAAVPDHSEPNKRRAPYAPRACDACRRRKGRCDGRNPCGYCLGRSVDCCYSYNPEERRANAAQSSASVSGSGSEEQAAKGMDWTSGKLPSLTDLVAALQGQLDAIGAQVRTPSRPSAVGLESPGRMDPAAIFVPPPQQQQQPPGMAATFPGKLPVNAIPCVSLKRTSRRFYGPTSPDYSLIAAQRLVQQGQQQQGQQQQGQQQQEQQQQQSSSDKSPAAQSIPSFDDNQSEDEEEGDQVVGSPAWSTQLSTNWPPRGALLQFVGLFTRHEAVRLIKVYHEAIGELHPICDIDKLLEQIEWSYGCMYGTNDDSDDMVVDEDSLLVLNLALSIALCAEGASKSCSAVMLYNSYRDVVNARSASPATGVGHVIIAILEGFYHFYMCNPRLAWRVIGLAGLIATEMGLHSMEVCKQLLETDQQRTEVATICCTLVILDRQWSSATGLPPNFSQGDFEMAQISLVRTPYLKAMMAFTLMSVNFNKYISQAASGNSSIDEDGIEVTAFQVKQWQKRALDKHNFIHPQKWNDSTEKPAAWTLVLYLRSNSVRSTLLRSFFLANPKVTDVNKIKCGLRLVSDTIRVLSILDKTTSIYRVQQPHFQHFLSSSCALLFLLVAYVEHRKAASLPQFPEDYVDTVRSNFEAALKLSAKYRFTFRQSHKLWKRITAMEEPLARLGILPRKGEAEMQRERAVEEEKVMDTEKQAEKGGKTPACNKQAAAAASAAASAPTAPLAGPSSNQGSDMAGGDPFDTGQQPVNLLSSAADEWASFDMQYVMQSNSMNPHSMGALPAAIASSNATMDVLDPLFLDWPMYTAQRFFSDSMP